MKEKSYLLTLYIVITLVAPNYVLAMTPEQFALVRSRTSLPPIYMTPFLHAVNKGQHRQVQQLLRKNCGTNRPGDCAMTLAALNNDIPMMQLLQQYGATISEKIFAAKLQTFNAKKTSKNLDTLNYLIYQGVAIEGTLSLYIPHPEYIQLLIDHGADVNKPSMYGPSPLLTAVEQNSHHNIALFLFKGAYRHSQEACMYTLLDAIVKYDSRYLRRKIKSKSLEEFCKRGVYITEETVQRATKLSPKMQKHPKALKRLLKQAAVLTQQRLETKQREFEAKNVPQVLIKLIQDFEVGQEADYHFLLKQLSN